LYAPSAGWFLKAAVIRVRSCSFSEPGCVGRFGVSPSQSQQWSPCEAVASSSFFSAAI
jgi:hypothetical protein